MAFEQQRRESDKAFALRADSPPGLFLTPHELAAVLKVSARTIRRLVAAGRLPVHRLGPNTLRFYLPEVVQSLATEKSPTP